MMKRENKIQLLDFLRHYFAAKIVLKTKNMGELKDVAELIGDSYEVIMILPEGFYIIGKRGALSYYIKKMPFGTDI